MRKPLIPVTNLRDRKTASHQATWQKRTHHAGSTGVELNARAQMARTTKKQDESIILLEIEAMPENFGHVSARAERTPVGLWPRRVPVRQSDVHRVATLEALTRFLQDVGALTHRRLKVAEVNEHHTVLRGGGMVFRLPHPDERARKAGVVRVLPTDTRTTDSTVRHKAYTVDAAGNTVPLMVERLCFGKPTMVHASVRRPIAHNPNPALALVRDGRWYAVEDRAQRELSNRSAAERYHVTKGGK